MFQTQALPTVSVRLGVCAYPVHRSQYNRGMSESKPKSAAKRRMWNFAVRIVMGLCIVQNLRDPGRYGTSFLIIEVSVFILTAVQEALISWRDRRQPPNDPPNLPSA